MSGHDITVLNTLIATTIDSANGFEEAARRANAPGLASQFAEFARDRWAVVTTLEDEIRRLGGTPRRQGTTKAAAHRRWLDLKNAVSGSDKAVVQEVENGESYIRSKYEAALSDVQLSEASRRAVTEAFDSVRRGHDSVRSLGLAHGTRSTSSQEGGIDWRRVGTGIGIAAAVGGAAYAANRMMSSRRQTTTGRRQRRGASIMSQPDSTTAGMSTAGTNTMAASGSSATRTGSSQPTALSAGSQALGSDTARGSGASSSTKRGGSSRSRGASTGSGAGMTAGMASDQPEQAQGFNASGDSSGSTGMTGIGSMGDTGNRTDLGKE